jgi:ubiquitin carboxyl-terminal hydrolase 16
MPEKTLTVATYAAGASLAAITLIYVFAPTYFLDAEPSSSSSSSGLFGGRRKGVVGLANPANDCFINAVLQALAGLGDLRLYLIRELHRRNLDDAWVYERPVPADAFRSAAEGADSDSDEEKRKAARHMPDWKIEGLQSGIVTKALKEILDALNERPIHRKTISAVPFVKSLEEAFRQRISRQQQDAQELLQVVAERVCDEYHAGRRARLYAKATGMVRPSTPLKARPVNGVSSVSQTQAKMNGAQDEPATDLEGTTTEKTKSLEVIPIPQIPDDEDEDGFPMEGSYESQIECLTCGFKPRPTKSTFCTLTLNVPQSSSTTLNACFDGMFKTEYIDDFKCASCRLLHAVKMLRAELQKSTSPEFRAKATTGLEKLQHAIDTDPEKPPPDVTLPDSRYAPRRRIARHIRMVSFPKILAVHLSRSTWDSSQMSLKNSAKVQFPERLPLGGLLQQRKYKLLGLVTHKGSHQSGHYESFRRQNVYPPFSNPSTFRASGVYSTTASPVATPQLTAVEKESVASSPLASTPDLLTPNVGADGSVTSLETNSVALRSIRGSLKMSVRPPAPTSAPREDDADVPTPDASTEATLTKPTVSLQRTSQLVNGSSTPTPSSSRPGMQDSPSRNSLTIPKPTDPSTASLPSPSFSGESTSKADPQQKPAQPQAAKPPARVKRPSDKWWRISDEKVKEATTREVLGMQREVYLLFYELERREGYP